MMLLCHNLAFAEGSALLITFHDGTTASYVLSEKPRVTFGDGTLQIATSDASTEYARADVSRFTFIDATEAGISQPTADRIAFEYRDNTVRVSGAPIEVYAADGTLVDKGFNTLSLANHSPGVYLVKVNRQVIKVMKK